ncbi:hypothetical protein [Deinococcus ruber]|uniref:Uncharacterized protein n=1 Tax=Deinococcus ruber TaxID=1848197 RepID=A0A918C4G8_9DEIO|nr:hypothetical protein [Deinococcus ruber]GGR04716.1 hypothetical protein GCM10008957_17020 [Deinococcus ruber]
MAHLWLPLPAEQVLYSGLPTDYYPWTEVYSDLTAQPRFSGVLEVKQNQYQGRSVWVGGELRGSYAPSGDLNLRSLSTAAQFARGSVSLSALDPAVAQLIWLCRDADQGELPLRWPDARDLLADRRFRGVLLSETSCSFWDDGRLLAGPLPQAGERLITITPRTRVAAPAPVAPALQGVQGLQGFWSEVLRASAPKVPIQALWSQSATRLADRHACLDPFAREVWYDGQSLQLSPDVPLAELREALLDQYRAMLTQAGVALRSLPLTEARAHPLWAASGLEE